MKKKFMILMGILILGMTTVFSVGITPVIAAPARNVATYITKDEAKQIAFDHAGVNATNATRVTIKLEYERGIRVYDIEFKSGGYEYEYDINATTGKVIKVEKERDKNYKPPTQNPTVKLTEAEAKQIAFDHAGVNATNTTRVTIKLEYERGIRVYDIEFKSLGFEYEYDVDVSTGDIVKFEKERDKNYKPPAQNPTVKITEAEAKQIAFDHAGVSQSQIRSLKIKLDYEYGMTLYEIEFKVGRVEYEYEINANTGVIYKFERDYD